MKVSFLTFFLTLYISCSFLSAYGQNNEVRAFHSYKKARKAYNYNNFSEAVIFFREAKEYLGKAHIHIQPMYIKSLYYTDDIQNAKVEIAAYYKLDRNRNSLEFEEIRKFERLVNKRYNEDKSMYELLNNLDEDLSEDLYVCEDMQLKYEKYLDDFPKGMYRKEIETKLLKIKDKIAFLYAKKSNSTESYDKYLSNYPSGIYSTKALSMKKELDYSAYQQAKNFASTSAYNKYLKNFPRGKYRSEIQELLNNKLDEDAYNKASKSNSISDYEEYIRNFPNGNHAYYANQIIQNSYFSWGNEAFKNKNYSSAKNYYSTLASRYPYGKYSSEVNRQINKCNRRLNQNGATYLMYSYDKFSPVGISFGTLNTNRLGFYWTLKMHPNIFKGFNVLYEIDDSGNSNSPWDTKRTGEQVDVNIAYSIGMTFKIVYPLWGYIGGGGGYYPTYTEVDEYLSNGDLHETVWMKNTDKTVFSLFPEAGLNLKISSAIVLKYGISYRKEIIHQFGLGIQL